MLLSVVVIPIVAASLPLDAAGRSSPSTDALVLWVPLAAGQEWLALFAYLGGYAAATGMVIVASVALATMISNDLVLPMLWRWRLTRRGRERRVTGDDPVGAPRRHRRRSVRRLRILPPVAERTDARVHRHVVAGRGGAVRAGPHRRGVLARREPRRRHRRPRGRLRHLDVHAADCPPSCPTAAHHLPG